MRPRLNWGLWNVSNTSCWIPSPCCGNGRVSLSVFWEREGKVSVFSEWEGKSLYSGNGRVSLCSGFGRLSLCVLGMGG